ncbi:hypothetical protein [Bradyrhizobium sp. USDA 3256]
MFSTIAAWLTRCSLSNAEWGSAEVLAAMAGLLISFALGAWQPDPGLSHPAAQRLPGHA